MKTKIALALSLVLAFSAAPAHSHDLLVDISPAPNGVVSSTSFEATLTFNNPILEIVDASNAELATKLAGTDQWQIHPITIKDKTLVAQIQVAEPGTYDLRWNVVSSDGHPISGDSIFVVDAVAAEEELAPVAMAATTTETNTSQDIPALLWFGIVMVALGAVFAPIGLMMRRKAKRS